MRCIYKARLIEVVWDRVMRLTFTRKQDLIVMRCKLEELWQKLEDHMTGGDWRRAQ